MSHVTVNDGLAIWQLAYYAIALILSVWVSARHGFLKSSGWIFLAIFSAIRIISSSSQIATITNKSETAVTISAITSLLGLSPLLLATLGILSRVYYSILKSPWNIIFSLAIVRIVQTPAAIALILCIIGATSATDPSEIDDQGTVKAGTILYLIVFVLISLLVIGAMIGLRTTERGEGRLLGAVAMSLPFLLIRIIYSLVAIFGNDKSFSTANGSTKAALINLFMVRIEEMVVVGIYLWGGLRQQPVPRNDDGTERSKVERMRYRTERGDFGFGKLGIASLAAHSIFEMLSPTETADDQREQRRGRPTRQRRQG
ncbi:hypothetical protein B0T10DRAFT_551138 [Thelonectria olida]|uniref:DUF7702 domain-containing protein n=1 Tax=Thelonectria olida TaxID=1576542 RepID=A0A9P8VXB4_9HYPO|nr:hypothetical protein B0T10DRAFT_551138 [Thelonectria olida]